MSDGWRALFDTSAAVAILNANEKAHARCVESLRQLQAPLHTTWPVITEAHYLLRHSRVAQSKLIQLAGSQAVTVHELPNEFFDWMQEFTQRYSDQEVQLADASLVWLAERMGVETVFTLDQRDFSTFRFRSGNELKMFQILPELI
jgi:predicted nucleic acid-binding protein